MITNEKYRTRAENRRTPAEEVIRRVEHAGFIFKDFVGEYINATSLISYQCEMGHFNTRSIAVFLRKPSCAECVNEKRRLAHKNSEDVLRKILEDRFCEKISGEYVDGKSEIEIRFLNCGHVETTTLERMRGKFSGLCRECAIKQGLADTREKERKRLLSFLETKGFNLVSFPNGYYSNQSIIKYTCSLGHYNSKKICSLITNPVCRPCSNKRNSGKNKGSWRGGITPLRTFLDKKIAKWKKASAAFYNYKCAITGESFDDIHHLVSFSCILSETLSELNLKNATVSEFTEEEMTAVTNLFVEKHELYGYGIPLARKVHTLFHSIYGQNEFTYPNQFYEFVDRINSGEILLPQ